jgi:hypothetical protein
MCSSSKKKKTWYNLGAPPPTHTHTPPQKDKVTMKFSNAEMMFIDKIEKSQKYIIKKY